MSDPQRRVAMITGGNSGIGFITASKLAAQGFHVILASRNQQSSTQAIARMQASNPNASVESLPLDLASFASVRQCAAAFLAKGYPLHLLINNAGGSVPGKQASFTTDGFEMTLGTNHLGHFLLTNLLLDVLKRSAPARVITVSSRLHDPAYRGRPWPDFDYDNLKGEKYYDPQVFYRNSKLANIWFAYELNRRLMGTGVTSNAVCPGFVPEAIGARRRYNHSTMWIIRGSPEGRLRKQSSGTVWLVTAVGRGSSPVLVDHYSQGMGGAGEIRTSSTVQGWCVRPAA